MRTSSNGTERRRALIIGGSIAGLFAALHLRRLGWHVDVFERTTGPMSARGAGIITHPQLRGALAHFGIETNSGFGVAIEERVVLDRADAVITRLACPQIATSWTHVHGALSGLLPEAHVHRGADLTRISEGDQTVTAHFADGQSASGDVLIGADGVRSTVRQHLFPDLSPKYAGYIAWRGLAPEAAVLRSAEDAMQAARFAFCLPPGEQMLSYLVPGPGHGLSTGQRNLNFVWYRPADAETVLPELLRDRHGVVHGHGIPPTLIRDEVIARMRADAAEVLTPWFQKVVAASVQPFLQPIFDLECPRMAVGRVALIGDAAFVVRPHLGGGVVKAAEDAAHVALSLSNDPGDVPRALARFSDLRASVGTHMVAQARRLGSYLKSTYSSNAERRTGEAASEPGAVLRETALLTPDMHTT